MGMLEFWENFTLLKRFTTQTNDSYFVKKRHYKKDIAKSGVFFVIYSILGRRTNEPRINTNTGSPENVYIFWGKRAGSLVRKFASANLAELVSAAPTGEAIFL